MDVLKYSMEFTEEGGERRGERREEREERPIKPGPVGKANCLFFIAQSKSKLFEPNAILSDLSVPETPSNLTTTSSLLL